MGGRGKRSSDGDMPTEPPGWESPPHYNVIPYDAPLGGAVYPFLKQTDRAWRILTRPLDAPADYHPADTFGLAEPTLRWVSDKGINDLFVDGMTAEQFLAVTGLELSLDKGAYVLSKRVSRLMRPYRVSGFFNPADIAIRYLGELDADGRKVWDGTGVISREMLAKLVLPEGANPVRQESILHEIKRAKRVEFTLMTANGQDKGHAIVADNLDVDFILPRDTKGEIRLNSGQVFVGINVVHGHEEMRLDLQSLINLYPFFDVPQLLTWLEQEGDLFLESVQNGTVAKVMARIDGYTTLEEVTNWPLREYLASGGQPSWFGSHVKGLINQHLQRLNHTTLEKLRLPIPGGRMYVMPEAVGRAAGVPELKIPAGEIKIDPDYATAWINDQDWLSLVDSPKGMGLADILGGADHDDALWLHPFTDHDNSRRVLAWRSPNQVGEYVMLKPTADSHVLQWATASDETTSFPAGDGRKLPPRIDHTDPKYLGLVGKESTIPSALASQKYHLAGLEAAVTQAQANQGALGMYCNSLMVQKALFGSLPDNPPAPLEAIVDGAVKTGADLSQVKEWNYQYTRDLLAKRVAVPKMLHGRLSFERERPTPPPAVSRGHWLDNLEQGVKAHIAIIETRRDELAQATMPPRELFDSAFSDRGAISIGAGLNQRYAQTLKRLSKSGRRPTRQEYEAARQAAEVYLAEYPAYRRPAILRGAMVSAYMGETPASDAAVWLPSAKGESSTQENNGKPSIAQQSIQALRDIGLLEEIRQTETGLLVYPNAEAWPSRYKTVGITGVWFQHYCRQVTAAGQEAPTRMGDVLRPQARQAKAWVFEQAKTGFRNLLLTVGDRDGRKGVFTDAGELIGYLSRDSQEAVSVDEELVIKYALARDGNLRAVIK